MWEERLCPFENKPADFVYSKADWKCSEDCISDSLAAMTKILDESSLKKEGLTLAHSGRV